MSRRHSPFPDKEDPRYAEKLKDGGINDAQICTTSAGNMIHEMAKWSKDFNDPDGHKSKVRLYFSGCPMSRQERPLALAHFKVPDPDQVILCLRVKMP